MRISKWNKGQSDSLFIIVIVALLILSWLNLGFSKTKSNSNIDPFAINLPPPSTSYQHSISNPSISSPVANSVRSSVYGQVNVELGNAASEYQPSREFIVLSGSSSIEKPINLSGWYLTNGKGSRTYQIGDNTTRYASDISILPLVSPIAFSSLGGSSESIRLPANGRVVVLSGSQNYNGNRVPSFRENVCTGYLTRDTKNTLYLYPAVSSSCPVPSKEVGVSNLDTACRQFVDSMNSCHTPNYVDSYIEKGVVQSGYVDRVGGLSQSCKVFLQSHYSYPSCVSNHANDKNFAVDSWRVFLNRPWEMWASEHDVITLYDAQGKVVSQYSY